MIAIFAALNEEVRSLKEEMSISRSSVNQHCRLFEGRMCRQDSLLVLTGVGKERAQQAAEIALRKFPLTAIISTGFSGALRRQIRVGDIVVYSGLTSAAGREMDTNPERIFQPDPSLMSLVIKSLQKTGLPYLIGCGVSQESVCVSPEDKEALGRQFASDSVDMESYWLARAAHDRNVPFITVRSIFDAVQDDLSILTRISSHGQINQGAALVQALSHPGQIKNMAQLAKNARKAERNLFTFLQKMLEKI